jgi:hypothetical protein
MSAESIMADDVRSAPATSKPRAPVRVPINLSRLFTTVLLGVVSLLISFFAFETSQYAEASADLDLLADRLTVAKSVASQRDQSTHVIDASIWTQIYDSAEEPESHRLWGALSERAQDAIIRSRVLDGEEASAAPWDARYLQELEIEGRAFDQLLNDVSQEARDAALMTSRLTGGTVIFSAALLLLTVATVAPRGARWALNSVAVAIVTVALVIGAVPLRLPGS